MRTGFALAVGAVAGVAAGAAVTYHFTTRSAARPKLTTSVAQPSASSALGARAKQAAANEDATRGDSDSTAARADLYRVAAGADAGRLEALIAAAAAEPSSAHRDFELAALLARYAELDPARAVELAREARLGGGVAARLYAAWAELDPDAALAALQAVDAPEDAAAIALAVLPALGSDGFDRVVAALGAGTIDGGRFFETEAATMTVASLAQGMARRDLARAIAQLRQIRDPAILQPFQTAVLREWARSDPEGVVDYVASLRPGEQQTALWFGSIRDLARADPRRAFELASRLAPQPRAMLQQTAAQTLAETDARTALRLVDSLPQDPQRQQILMTIAGPYGRQHPDEALAWARSLGDQRGLLGAVIAGIARSDPDRAFALAATAPQAEKYQSVQAAVMSGLMPGADPAAMAERVLALVDSDSRTIGLSMLIGPWASRAPQQALDWLAANGGRVPEDSYRNAAQAIAEADPATAARYVAQVPTAVRADWIQAVAQAYARTDVEQGVGWLEQVRSEPGYAQGVETLTQRLSQTDPARAARLLATVDGPRRERSNSVPFIASQWALRDPAAAAQWVLGLETHAARARAIPSLMSAWANSDPPAARDWSLRLPAGSERDAALGTVLIAAAMGGPTADQAVISAFSNRAALERAVMNAVAQLAPNHTARAHEVAATYLPDAGQRARADHVIDEIRAGRAPGEVFQIELEASQ
jgi:hypothetical protein